MGGKKHPHGRRCGRGRTRSESANLCDRRLFRTLRDNLPFAALTAAFSCPKDACSSFTETSAYWDPNICAISFPFRFRNAALQKKLGKLAGARAISEKEKVYPVSSERDGTRGDSCGEGSCRSGRAAGAGQPTYEMQSRPLDRN